MLYVKEKKEIEVGGANIVINGKKIDKNNYPLNYELVQAIRKEFPDQFKEFGIDFEETYPDIIIDGNTLILNDESGKEILNKNIEDTKIIKGVLK
jgi:hypothetical protein